MKDYLFTLFAVVTGLACGSFAFHLIVKVFRRLKYGKTEDFDLHGYLDEKKKNKE